MLFEISLANYLPDKLQRSMIHLALVATTSYWLSQAYKDDNRSD
jgi:hypothetical protein